ERARMPVEEVLVLGEIVVVADVGHRVLAYALPQPTEPGVRQPFQGSPQDFVSDTADVEDHSPVALSAAENGGGGLVRWNIAQRPWIRVRVRATRLGRLSPDST